MPDEPRSDPIEVVSSQQRRPSLWWQLRHDKVGVIGLVITTVSLLAAVLGPLVAPHDPTAFNAGHALEGPSRMFLLGTDEFGRDLFSRALFGARTSLQVSLIVVLVAGFIGVSIGLIAGYFRGVSDAVLMRIVDVVFAFPTILLALVVVAVLGTELIFLILALVIVYIPAFARVTRAAALTVSEEPYVEAARVIGVPPFRILLRYVFPNIVAPIAVQFTVSLAYAILIESTLSYLGLGVQPPVPSWGSMLAYGKLQIESSPWPSIVPGVWIMLTVLGFNLLGDALRDALDPKLRSRGIRRAA